MLLIREYDAASHLKGVQACLVELQNFERALDMRMPLGEDIVEFYVPAMMLRCTQCDGTVLVAEIDNEVAGYVTVLAKVKSENIEDGDYEYGLIADLVVLNKHRQQGVGKKLLRAAEAYASSRDVKWLKIGVLAGNHVANDFYESEGFKVLFVEREKSL
jgi:ribosomal protein S18 acetylase RimI-like enzyme